MSDAHDDDDDEPDLTLWLTDQIMSFLDLDVDQHLLIDLVTGEIYDWMGLGPPTLIAPDLNTCLVQLLPHLGPSDPY